MIGTAIQRLGERLRGLITAAMMAALAAIVALTFCDVLARHLFNSPIFGANDITEHLMALIVFLGLPLISIEGGHLTADLFDRYILRPALWPWHVMISVIMSAVLTIAGLVMLIAAQEAVQFREISQALNVPRSGFYSFFAASCFFSAVAVLVHGWQTKGQSYEDKQAEIQS
jgi:TRAP-type C4-dicarboxylate transport system permease small subunit